MNTRIVALAATVLVALAAPLAAPVSAQTAPAPAATPGGWPTIPPDAGSVVQSIVRTITGQATAGYGLDPNHVRGSVTYFRHFDLQLRMPLNRYRDVHLHQGTIIDPRGATITPGSVIDVRGRANSDGSLDADRITIVSQ